MNKSLEDFYIDDSSTINSNIELLVADYISNEIHMSDDLCIFMSQDMMTVLLSAHFDMSDAARQTGYHIASIVTTFGNFKITPVYEMKKFIFFGTPDDLKTIKQHGIPIHMLSNQEYAKLNDAIEDMIYDG